MDTSGIQSATARAEIYRFLALAFADPVPGAAARLQRQWPIAEAGLHSLGMSGAEHGCATAVRLSEADLKRAHVACFGHAVSKDCPPYEAEYGQAHIFEKTQTLADVTGFYRAFGLALADSARDRPDHLAFELEFMEFLCQKQAFAAKQGHPSERIALCHDAQRAFLDEHLGRWAFGFAHRVIAKSPTGIHAAVAGLLDAFLSHELAAMGITRHADPFLNEGDKDRIDDGACAACPGLAGTGAADERRVT